MSGKKVRAKHYAGCKEAIDLCVLCRLIRVPDQDFAGKVTVECLMDVFVQVERNRVPLSVSVRPFDYFLFRISSK